MRNKIEIGKNIKINKRQDTRKYTGRHKTQNKTGQDRTGQDHGPRSRSAQD